MTSANPYTDVEAVKSEIREAVINLKANACPMMVRLAWHASGTYDASDSTGGINGATMRFGPENLEDANAGLGIARDLLLPVKKKHPELSYGDLWALAGAAAVEFSGGPKVAVALGRSDAHDGSCCPAIGRLPDAHQGAQHLRDVFYRMGLNDQEIVALSGGHTLGRCHPIRSGFDGPWTRNPLRFDNSFFRNLVNLEWQPRKWDGPLQFEDTETRELMMLPTDMALLTDAKFRQFTEIYAKDQARFFKDFSKAYEKLIHLGVTEKELDKPSTVQATSAEFRHSSMHGSFETVKKLAPLANVNEKENASGRTALHKAAFWGHANIMAFLCSEIKMDLNAQDCYGDSALHDAARFGHDDVVKVLLKAGVDKELKNEDGLTAHGVAVSFMKPDTAQLLVPSKL